MLVFDLETGPVDDEILVPLCPEFEPPPRPGVFDPASVKCGNIKDQAKIDAKIIEAAAAHQAAAANYEKNVAAARDNHLADFRSKAALSPITGRVLAIGFKNHKGARVEDGGGDEAVLIAKFWDSYLRCKKRLGTDGPLRMAGWNIHGFDLPFLVRRSWLLGVTIPSTIRDQQGRYWDGLFIDLMVRFAVGAWKENVKLDLAAKFFGVGAKPDGVNGGDFARLWFGTAAEKEQAVSYLLNDLDMTAKVAERMGIV